jgi:hypothetical protein
MNDVVLSHGFQKLSELIHALTLPVHFRRSIRGGSVFPYQAEKAAPE